jgi:hypothetical protein
LGLGVLPADVHAILRHRPDNREARRRAEVRASADLSEEVVAFREKVAIGLEMAGARYMNSPALEALQST